MSAWQSYIDEHLLANRTVLAGVILGLDGSIWAGSPGWNVTPEESNFLFSCFDDVTLAQQSGLYAFQNKFMFITHGHDEHHGVTLVGKQGQNGIVCYRANQCVIIGYHDQNSTTPNCRLAVEKLGGYFRQIGY